MLLVLTGCSVEVPEFLGREGTGDSNFGFSAEPLPTSEPIQVTSARVETALRGIIVRVDGLSPTQGYYGAQLERRTPAPIQAEQVDQPTSGLIELNLIAFPPPEPETVGPASTRVLRAAIFLPTRLLEDATGVRVYGGEQATTIALN